MLFKEELAQLIIERKKTQTRRPVKAGEKLVEIDGLKTVLHANGRIKWQVGREYAVQFGRGLPTRLWHPVDGMMAWIFYREALAQKGAEFLKISALMGWKPLKIKLLDVWWEDVRDISHENSLAEGFSGAAKHSFLYTWTSFYDKPMAAALTECEYDPNLPDHCPLFLGERIRGYEAYALKFNVVTA